MKWVRDHRVENLLKELGVSYTEETVAVSSIDDEGSMRKQVRCRESLNPDVVLNYAVAMDNKDMPAAFPRPILEKPKKGPYEILSGFHRTAACKEAKVQTMDAYVVSGISQAMRDMICNLVNAIEAVYGMNNEERFIKAKYLIDTYNMPLEKAASIYGLKKKTLEINMRTEAVRARAEAVTGKTLECLNRKTLREMAGVSHNDNILADLVGLVEKHELNGKAVKDVIDDVKKQTTELQQRRVIGEWDNRFSELNKPKPKSAERLLIGRERSRLVALLNGLERYFATHKTREQCQLVDVGDFNGCLSLWKRIRKGASGVFGEGQ